jgi:hypothetical protein
MQQKKFQRNCDPNCTILGAEKFLIVPSIFPPKDEFQEIVFNSVLRERFDIFTNTTSHLQFCHNTL